MVTLHKRAAFIRVILIAFILIVLAIISFFPQRGYHYPISLVLLFLFCIYLFFYGKLKFFLETGLTKCIFVFLLIILFSSINYIENKEVDVPVYYLISFSLVFGISFFLGFFSGKIEAHETLFRLFSIFYFFCGIIYNIYSLYFYRQVLDIEQYNTFYYVLFSLPLLFLFLGKNWYIKYLFFIPSFIFCILSLKRSAFISSFLGLFFLLFVDLILFKSKRWLKIFFLLISFVFLLGNLDINNEYNKTLRRIDNIEEDGGSGRTTILNRAIKEISEFNVFELSFGKGFASYGFTNNKNESSSHNDFIEVLYSYGLIGLFCFLFFLVLIIKRFFFFLKFKSVYLSAYGLSIIFLLIYSLVGSLFYYQFFSIPLFLFWGYMESKHYLLLK